MAVMKADYKQDILKDSMGGKRHYRLSSILGTNDYIIEDVSEYEQEGDTFGSSDINSTNLGIMGFISQNVTFADDGTITETASSGEVLKTTFDEDGTIHQELRDSSGMKIASSTIKFNEDGSISTVVD